MKVFRPHSIDIFRARAADEPSSHLIWFHICSHSFDGRRRKKARIRKNRKAAWMRTIFFQTSSYFSSLPPTPSLSSSTMPLSSSLLPSLLLQHFTIPRFAGTIYQHSNNDEYFVRRGDDFLCWVAVVAVVAVGEALPDVSRNRRCLDEKRRIRRKRKSLVLEFRSLETKGGKITNSGSKRV